MRKVKDAVDLTTNEKIYFKGHAKATYTSEGKDVESELTELSEEVSGLSERVDNLPTAESSLFEAVYGETPYNDIIAASKARKHVICYYKNFIYNLTKCQEGYDIKFSCADMEVLTIICKVNGGWSTSNAGHELIMNKVTSLSEKSTDTQYPSAKAVYDVLQNVGGGEPSQYIKDATTSADGNTLTLTKKDNTQVVFSPSGGGGGSTPSGGNDEMQRILAGNTPNLIWEDLDGKLHYEHGELASRKAQNDPTFKTTCRKILSFSPQNTIEWAFLFGVQDDKGTIEEVYPYLFAPVTLTSLNYAFSGAPNIKDWSFLKFFNTSNITLMVGVFYGASADYIDVSNWDTSNVTKMYNVFGGIRSIIGLNKWNVSKVENMDYMFCSQTEDIGDVSNWDVSNCSSFKCMFRENHAIKNIDLSSWAIKSGASISNMFFNMGRVKTIGFPNIANGCTSGSTGRYLNSLTSIFFKEGSTFGCSLSFNESPLTAESVKQLLAHASSTPDEGATLTFGGGLYASFSAEDKVEIDALRNVAVANGWTIVNMG